MAFYKFGTITSTSWSGTTTKNARWVVRWYSYPMDEPGVTKVHYTLYKTQDATSSNSVDTACIMNVSATKGTFRGNQYTYCIPVHGDTPGGGGETYGLTTNGFNYQSGTYQYGVQTTGCSFKATYQLFPENEILPSDAQTNLSYYGTPHLEGEFYMDHDSNGEAEVNFQLKVWIYYSIGNYPSSGERGTVTGTATMDINYKYTEVTAPGRFRTSFDTTVPVAPNSTVTFSWYDSDHGVNNQIDHYQVNFYAVTSDFNTQTLIGTATPGHEDGVWTSASINLGAVTALTQANLRGRWITCSVQTIGSVTGYDSEVVWSEKGCLVNRKPAAPTIKQNTSKVAAAGGNVSFTGSVGSDSDTSITTNIFTDETMATTTATLKYKIGSATTYTEVTGATFSVPISAGTSNVTINFYTYDGIEYSAATAITVTRNTKPAVTLFVTPSYINQSTDYVIASSLSATESSGKTGMSYVFGVKYSTNQNLSSATKVELRALNTSATFSTDDIRSAITNFATLSNAFYYTFYVQGYDGYDLSDEVTGSTYYIPAKPTFSRICNKLNGETVSNLGSYFSNNISMVFALDDGYDSAAIYSPTTIPATLVKSGSNMIVNVENIPQTLTGGQAYTFNVNFYKNNQLRYQTKLTTSSLTRVQTFRTGLVNDYRASDMALKIYSDTGKKNLALSITLTKSDGTLPDLTNLSTFGISDIYSSCYLNIGNNANRIQLSLDSSTFAYQDSAGTIIYNYPISQALFTAIKNELNLNGTTGLPISFDIKDDFGSYVKASSSTGIYFDCREAATCETAYGSGSYQSNYMAISNSSKSTYHTLVNGNYLVQGMYLFYTGSILSYNTNPTGQIWIKRGDDNWMAYGSSFKFSQTSTGTSAPGSPMTYSVTRQLINNIVKIARKDYSVSFKIVVNTDGGVSYEYIFITGLTAKEHQSGTISVTNVSYSSSSNTLDLTYVVNNPGINLTSTTGTTITANFTIEYNSGATTNLSISSYIPNANKLGYDKIPYTTPITKQLSLSTEDSAFYGTMNVQIAYTYTIGGLTFTNTHTTTSSRITIYNEAPTVSYRKNRLGINTNQVDAWTEAVLVISANNSERKKILIVTPETVPSNATNYVLSIDTYTGVIDGAIFDGGTWS